MSFSCSCGRRKLGVKTISLNTYQCLIYVYTYIPSIIISECYNTLSIKIPWFEAVAIF